MVLGWCSTHTSPPRRFLEDCCRGLLRFAFAIHCLVYLYIYSRHVLELFPPLLPLALCSKSRNLTSATALQNMSSYPVNPPPSYGAAPSPTKPNNSEEAEPLLFQSVGAGPSHGNAIYDMPDDLPDDFKVNESRIYRICRLVTNRNT